SCHCNKISSLAVEKYPEIYPRYLITAVQIAGFFSRACFNSKENRCAIAQSAIHPSRLSPCPRDGGCQTGIGLSRFQVAGFVDASQRTPATALARSSCPPRGWSTLSRPPRAVRRSRHTSWCTRRSSSKRSTARLLTDGNNATYNSDFDLSATS